MLPERHAESNGAVQDRAAAELERPAFPELLGVTELAEILKVTRQRAHTLASSPAFPDPIARLAAGPVWTKPSITHFLESWERKAGRPKKVAMRKKAVSPAS